MRSSLAVVLNQEWVIAQLIEVVSMAKAQGKPDLAAANKALNLIGLHLGMYIERTEHGRPGDFDGLTIAAKRDRMLGVAQQLGIALVGHAGRLGAIDPKDITPSPLASSTPPTGGEPS
jgi:hypothetical protein